MIITTVAIEGVTDLNRMIQIRPYVWYKVSGIVVRSVHFCYQHLLTGLFSVHSSVA